MEIKTKYNIHDKVNIQDYITTQVICPICDGKGTVTIKNNDFCCPNCAGNKMLKVETKKSMTVEITDIIISINSNNHIEIKYISDYSGWGAENYHTFYEEDLDKPPKV